MKIDPKTEKLVEAKDGLRIEGEETIGKDKNERTYRWMRYVTHNNDVEKKEESK